PRRSRRARCGTPGRPASTASRPPDSRRPSTGRTLDRGSPPTRAARSPLPRTSPRPPAAAPPNPSLATFHAARPWTTSSRAGPRRRSRDERDRLAHSVQARAAARAGGEAAATATPGDAGLLDRERGAELGTVG